MITVTRIFEDRLRVCAEEGGAVPICTRTEKGPQPLHNGPNRAERRRRWKSQRVPWCPLPLHLRTR